MNLYATKNYKCFKYFHNVLMQVNYIYKKAELGSYACLIKAVLYIYMNETVMILQSVFVLPLLLAPYVLAAVEDMSNTGCPSRCLIHEGIFDGCQQNSSGLPIRAGLSTPSLSEAFYWGCHINQCCT